LVTHRRHEPQDANTGSQQEVLAQEETPRKECMQVQQGSKNVLGASRLAATPKAKPGDGGDDNDESERKRDSDPMDKNDDDDKVMEEEKKEIEIQDPTPSK